MENGAYEYCWVYSLGSLVIFASGCGCLNSKILTCEVRKMMDRQTVGMYSTVLYGRYTVPVPVQVRYVELCTVRYMHKSQIEEG